MKHQNLDDSARVWTITMDDEGRVRGEIDARLFAQLNPDMSAQEIADALVVAAGEAEVAQTRAW